MKQVWKGTFSAIMAVTMLAGCSSTAAASPAATASAAAATTAAGAASAGTFTPDANDGKVVNIYVWNDEFKTRFEDYYADKFPAGYTYNFVTTPSDNNAYQNALDEALLNQDSAAADDKVDMFLVEADYILKYVNSDYTLDLNSIGVTADDMKNQYEYTKTIAQDSNSTQKGISWQACPGLYI
ncbi:MAG: carbohydrate ABC transporter substrate-binding protein, partial [Erysipelotrichia bacterium]|nr:carbohydrate ABC transporter substrate-binding protein [Erysipelotrichia bacterium]